MSWRSAVITSLVYIGFHPPVWLLSVPLRLQLLAVSTTTTARCLMSMGYIPPAAIAPRDVGPITLSLGPLGLAVLIKGFALSHPHTRFCLHFHPFGPNVLRGSSFPLPSGCSAPINPCTLNMGVPTSSFVQIMFISMSLADCIIYIRSFDSFMYKTQRLSCNGH